MRPTIPLHSAGPLLAALLATTAAVAHPGVGIVEDSAGNVFYTDLAQVWRIAPDGTKSVAVPGVHTHELCLDAEDNLYGEHLWYEGDATKKWGHRVWKRTRDGAVSDVIPAREGFLSDASFVRDRSGAMYWADRGVATVVRKRAPDGAIGVHSTGPFRDVRWMTATPDGIVYLVDSGRLLRVASDGKVVTVVAALSEKKPSPAKVADPHYQGGLFTGPKGSVYVTVAAESLVLEVRPDGTTSVAARSPFLWAAYGGMIDRSGNLWLLETSVINAVRVRRIGRDGKERVY
jgi:hypothetical protein